MFTLTLRHKFDAAHFLPNHEGKCKNLHGHTWKVEIVVEGAIDARTAMLVDFSDLKDAVDDLFDHSLLNDMIENPTAEAIAEFLYWEIHELLRTLDNEPHIEEVTVWESEDASSTYRV